MRRSDKQGLRIGACEQLAPQPGRTPQHGIDDWSLPFWRKLDRLMDCCVLSRFEKKKLIQAESQNITDIIVNPRSAQATDPKI